MVGVVLTAGLGTRLRPVTQWVNKTVLPVGNHPMVYYPIYTLVASGINDIVIVVGPPYAYQVRKVVSEIKIAGVKFRFAVQKKLNGFAGAIACTKKMVKGNSVMVVGGDTLHAGTYEKYVRKFKTGAIGFLRKVDDPRRYGVPIYNKVGKLVNVLEKPRNPKNQGAICGPLFFDNGVYGIINKLKPSSRGELEITDVYKHFIKDGRFQLIKAYDFHQDMGTLASFADVNGKVINHKIKFQHDYN